MQRFMSHKVKDWQLTHTDRERERERERERREWGRQEVGDITDGASRRSIRSQITQDHAQNHCEHQY